MIIVSALTWVIFKTDQLVTFIVSICMGIVELNIKNAAISDVTHCTLVMDWFGQGENTPLAEEVLRSASTICL